MYMRIALCLSNHVGMINNGNKECENEKFLKNIKNVNDKGFNQKYLENQADPKICFNSIKKHILDCNNSEIDIFIHSWDFNLEKKILKLYNPKKYKFENNNEIKFNYNSFNKNHISRYYSINYSIKLKKQYEIENNFTYDFVMWSRIDYFYYKDIIIDRNLDSRYIYQEYCVTQKINDNSIMPPTKYFMDSLAISSSKNIDLLGNILNSNKKDYFKNHTGFFQYFKDHNVELRNLKLFNIYHVNRIYVLHQFLEFNKISKEYFLKKYDLLSIGEKSLSYPPKCSVSLKQILKINPNYRLEIISKYI